MPRYDINFLLPVTPTIPKYMDRIADMKRYGIVNAGNTRTLITLLVEAHYDDVPYLTHGWHAGIDVDYIRIPFMNVEHKFATYYTAHLERVFDAKWQVRIDDDSSTDVMALMNRLREYDYRLPHHLIAHQCGDVHNLLPEYIAIFRRMGYTGEMTHEWLHSWEISVDSYAAIKMLASNNRVNQLYTELLKSPQDKTWWTDQVFCYAMRMCGVFPHITNFLSKDPNVGKFSFTGGKYCHIHYVSRDQHAGKWAHFVKTMNKQFDKLGNQSNSIVEGSSSLSQSS